MDVTIIGRVSSPRAVHRWDGWGDVVSEIHILPEFAKGLEGLADYSHIIVVHAMENHGKVNLTVTPQCKPSSPEVGIFASRCMWRPTPVGVTTVLLIEVIGNVLTVAGLDAIDGAQVFDIKPYWPQYDAVEDEHHPAWVDELEF